MRLFLSFDGRTGFALDGDNLVSVFSHAAAPNRRLAPIVYAAVAAGARRLDTFDTGLPKKYAELGWREVKRVPWDDQYAPKNWPYASLGTPDVVYMEYAP